MEYEKGNKWINFLFRAISDLCGDFFIIENCIKTEWN